MKSLNKQTGGIGEAIAVKFLVEKGYKVLQTNFSCKTGEIDIIAIDKDVLVFVEVKMRSNLYFGLPQEAITHRKLLHMQRTAITYLKLNDLIDKVDVRFDCVAIVGSKQDHTIEHIEGIC